MKKLDRDSEEQGIAFITEKQMRVYKSQKKPDKHREHCLCPTCRKRRGVKLNKLSVAKAKFATTVPSLLKQRLYSYSEQTNIPIAQVTEKALLEFLNREEENERLHGGAQ
jgi:hypothetical protein